MRLRHELLGIRVVRLPDHLHRVDRTSVVHVQEQRETLFPLEGIQVSTMKRVQVLGGGGIAAAILAKMAESVKTVEAYPQLRENPPKVSRKERRQMERSAAKQAKRSSK